jgi:hypothetical protein
MLGSTQGWQPRSVGQAFNTLGAVRGLIIDGSAENQSTIDRLSRGLRAARIDHAISVSDLGAVRLIIGASQ